MRYHEIPPPSDLAPFVQCVWELESDGTALGEPIFPDGRIELVFHLGDRPAPDVGDAQPAAMVVGQMTTGLRLRPVTRLHCVGLRFTPVGARAWLRLPLHELRDRIEPLADICGAQAVRLLDAVAEARTTGQRTARVLDQARTILRDATPPPPGLQTAVAFTLAREGRATVESMAAAAGWSARQLERLFLDAIGLPPKAFARVVRFQHAVRDLQRGVPPAQVAASRGFADQSHLAREFKRMAGVPARAVDLGRVAFVQDAEGRPPQH